MEKLPVKVGILTLDNHMTRAQALRYGRQHMPSDLKRVGFDTFVSKSDAEMHGGVWFRISYGYKYYGVGLALRKGKTLPVKNRENSLVVK